MNRLHLLAISVIGLAAAALLLDLIEPQAIHAAVSTLVTVANTPSVNVANTPSVTVNSLPAVQLSGAVTVTNGSDIQGNPILKVQDDAARHGFKAAGGCSFVAGQCDPGTLYTVPANEIAVVQSASGLCNLGGASYDQLENVAVADTILVPGPPVFVGGGALAHQSFHANLTGVYVSTSFGAGATSLSTNDGASSSCVFIVSGYLVPQ